MNRRRFIRYALVGSGQMILGGSLGWAADDPGQNERQQRARQAAEAFLDQFLGGGAARLPAFELCYDIHLKVSWNIRMIMQATVGLRPDASGYTASFRLTEPEGANGWSWLMLTLFGRHTQDYREMIKGIETRLVERFRYRNGRFRTDRIEEILPDTTDYANQTAIKVDFAYPKKNIRFWKDKHKRPYDAEMPFDGQVGPLTAFFNYLCFDAPQTQMTIVNVLKEVRDADSPMSANKTKAVRYLFEAQQTRFSINTTKHHTDYRMMVSLERGNFLDIVYGDYLYYQLAHSRSRTIKIPYAAHIEGIISKNKKRKKIKKLKKAYPRQQSFESLLLAQVDDILAARDIKVYFKGYETKSGQATPPVMP